jgi:hypothetical protein
MTVSVDVLVDDDWPEAVARPVWSVIDGHFVIRVAHRSVKPERLPVDVIALRLTEMFEGEFVYSSERATASYDVASNPTLEFNDGQQVDRCWR